MLRRTIKYGVIASGAALIIGLAVFGTEVFSYARSSLASLQEAAKDSVPVEFELQRARRELEQMVPEMHANIRLIAQEEVEIERLAKEIDQTTEALANQKAGIEKLSGMLHQTRASYQIGSRTYQRAELTEDLSRRFERYKEAEMVLQGKRKLLSSRRQSLETAMQQLGQARHNKALLAARIETLASKHRLVQAAAAGSRVDVDASRLARTEKLLNDVSKRLDVAERVLAHEGRFVEPVQIDLVSEEDLLSEVAEHFDATDKPAPAGPTDALAATEPDRRR